MSAPNILEINLSEREGEPCCACGARTDHKHGLPMLDGEILENTATGEWYGRDACKACFDAHALGGLAALNIRLAALAERAAEIDGLRTVLQRIKNFIEASGL